MAFVYLDKFIYGFLLAQFKSCAVPSLVQALGPISLGSVQNSKPRLLRW